LAKQIIKKSGIPQVSYLGTKRSSSRIRLQSATRLTGCLFRGQWRR
jgi:hypothetical protein